MNTAAFLVSCLENERVGFAFGIPGDENLELMDSLRDSSIRFVLTRHEEAAAFMADVLARLTTHAGVCLATSGPRATNLVTGLAGAGVIRSGASDELLRFAEGLGIPVAHTFMGKGSMPWTSPMSLLTIGVLPGDYDLAGFNESDLVICVGFDFVEYDPRSWNPRGDRRIVHVDSLPAEISVHYVPEVEVTGEIAESLRLLRERIGKPRESAWAQRTRGQILKRLQSDVDARAEDRLKPQRIMWELRDILTPDDLLISDVGAHKLWLGRFFRTIKPNTVVISNGLSAMGIDLPGGIAATLADPDRRVGTVRGGGGFRVSLPALAAAQREK